VSLCRPKEGKAVLSQYGFIAVFAVIAIGLPLDTWVQFKAQYYLYALIFVVFDVEAVFIFPWAVAYHKLGLYALVEMILFVAILVGGLLYAWRKGALEWH
jgi:NADH:ubiquinone oxidoreductase subunit 3 (subunit A)